MFTGIVEEVGTVAEVSPHRLVVAAPLVTSDLEIGDSVAINGTCLTAVKSGSGTFAVDVVQETLDRTNLGKLAAGDIVNLERALTPSDRMGGHIVQGHVDGVGVVRELGGPEEARVLRVEAPESLMRYVVEKGFIAVDGISLTVTGVHGATFSIAVIPYTSDHTVLHVRRPGDLVNLEVDIVAKYVERLLRRSADYADWKRNR